MNRLMVVDIWTDGSGTVAGCPMGWCAILRCEGREKVVCGAAPDGTSQRAELRAVIEGLRALTKPALVVVHSDSEYVVKGFTEDRVARWAQNGYKTSTGKPIKNPDLWQALAREVDRHFVTWEWLKGHAGSELNERADQIAGEQRALGLKAAAEAIEAAIDAPVKQMSL